MKLDDIAKLAISEVSAELEKIENLNTLQEQKNELARQSERPKFHISEANQARNTNEVKSVNEVKDASEQTSVNEVKESGGSSLVSREILNSEVIFLTNLKERTEVLFEGLNEMPKELVNERLELTLKFLEFVLANVENRLENLPK